MAWTVDRLGRSLQDLVTFLTELHALGIDLFLHQQGLDTTTPAGKAMFQMMGTFAEFERSMIQERVRAGLRRPRSRLRSRRRYVGGIAQRAGDRHHARRQRQYSAAHRPRAVIGKRGARQPRPPSICSTGVPTLTPPAGAKNAPRSWVPLRPVFSADAWPRTGAEMNRVPAIIPENRENAREIAETTAWRGLREG
jgi:Resolvase, N terminal domain